MTASRTSIFGLCLLLTSCTLTDLQLQSGLQAPPPGETHQEPVQNWLPAESPIPPSQLFLVGVGRYGNNLIVPAALQVIDNMLYVSGGPVGLMTSDLDLNPDTLLPTFAAAENVIAFSPIGMWMYDHVASGAIAQVGHHIVTSGTMGISVIDNTSPSALVEAGRFPGLAPDGSGELSDASFIYRGIVSDGSRYFGFRQQDRVYTMDLVENSDGSVDVQPVSQLAYPAGGHHLVTSATRFQDVVYVAATDALATYQIDANHTLGGGSWNSLVHATYVTSSPNYLYIQVPGGIAVLDAAGAQAAFLNSSQVFEAFAVSADDGHLYAKVGGQLVIYRLR